MPMSWCAQVWLGYQQSLRPCESGLTLNVDLAATAFLQVQARWACRRQQQTAGYTACGWRPGCHRPAPLQVLDLEAKRASR